MKNFKLATKVRLKLLFGIPLTVDEHMFNADRIYNKRIKFFADKVIDTINKNFSAGELRTTFDIRHASEYWFRERNYNGTDFPLIAKIAASYFSKKGYQTKYKFNTLEVGLPIEDDNSR